MARNYQVTFVGVTVSAAQDLVQITVGTKKLVRILRMWVGQTAVSLATGQGMSLRARFLPATVTVGSGGTTGITPSKKDAGDAACSAATCATNNTTQATTSGTAVILWAEGCHLYQGIDKRLDNTFPVLIEGTAFVFELLSTVSGTVALSGGVDFEEMG